MKRTYRYRLYLTSSQISYLENAFSMCRYLYNWNLEERVEIYKKEGRTVTYLEQQNNLPALKKVKPWFKGVYSLVLQDTLRRHAGTGMEQGGANPLTLIDHSDV